MRAIWELAGLRARLSAGAGLGSAANHTALDVDIPGYPFTQRDQTWYWSHSLLLHLRNSLQLTGGLAMDLRLSAPVFSLVTRPREGHWLDAKNMEVMESFWKAATHGRREFLWENPVVYGSIEFRTSVSGSLDFWARYGLIYASFDVPTQMKALTHSFQGGCAVTF